MNVYRGNSIMMKPYILFFMGLILGFIVTLYFSEHKECSTITSTPSTCEGFKFKSTDSNLTQIYNKYAELREKFYDKSEKYVTSHGYWVIHNPKTYILEPDIGVRIAKLAGTETVADLGAGVGRYVQVIARNGANVIGYEGALGPVELTHGLIRWLDLTERHPISYYFPEFGWTSSLEVAEHIPAEYENIYIYNLFQHSRVGMIISWAPVGQDGVGHVNERPHEYVINKFESLGLEYHKKNTEYIRNYKTVHFTHYRGNMMVFMHTEESLKLKANEKELEKKLNLS